MELRQLRYLVALAEELNFTRAAESEHIAQPALSQQIRKLEEELGVALVERTTRHVSLTEAGQLLAVRARRILSELESARAELEALRGIDRGHVTIGAIHTMGPIDLSLALAEFHALYPQVALSVREHTSDECAELLRIDEVDLAFLSVTERVESHELGLHQLISEELLVLLPIGHPLARHEELRELLFSAGRDAQFEPRVTLESNESHRIRTFVSRGLGVAILPRSDAIGQGAEVAVARLVAPALRRDITLAWRAGRRHSPAAQAFIELARETFTDETAGPGAATSIDYF